MDCEEERAIQYFYKRTRNRFRVKKMVLYDSNLDKDDSGFPDMQLLLLTENSATNENRKVLSRIAAEVHVEFGISIRCWHVNIIRWRRGENISPLLKEKIETDGIDVLKGLDFD